MKSAIKAALLILLSCILVYGYQRSRLKNVEYSYQQMEAFAKSGDTWDLGRLKEYIWNHPYRNLAVVGFDEEIVPLNAVLIQLMAFDETVSDKFNTELGLWLKEHQVALGFETILERNETDSTDSQKADLPGHNKE